MVRANVGDHTSEGEGSSIKKSIHVASSKMLSWRTLSEPKIQADPNMHPVRILDKLCMKSKKPAQVYAYTETELGFNVRVGLEKHRATGEGRNLKKNTQKRMLLFQVIPQHG